MPLSLPAQASIDVYEFQTPEQETTYQELTATLRCPKCQNNNIADSNAELAKDMRQKVYEMLKQGKSKQDIIDYMIARYGNFVTYNPPVMPSTLILWLGPLCFLLIGASVLVYRSRRGVQPDAVDEQDSARLDALLKEIGQEEDSRSTQAADGENKVKK
ncbi:cytochrome c-type biogenesis protein CcmH [Photobacterium sp. GJ3]|uniref:cytochrome c-type biogenesis protein n=1 Tax=Photobacterium sp. GJ3 TaxID=2829502 RepID=UPI001B8BD83F|nr:cytochrome c-type biogenesis protein [Photobacterium sp. GJ3]QUJ69142.1 cytochrome c-type biogenesis protein CcmH [Photobacterium sp. GJ3]